MTQIHLGIPYTRPFWGATVKSLILTHAPGMVALDFQPYVAVDVARNNIVRNFLENEHAAYLWFVDNDCVFDPQALMRLLSRDVPMVCGTMFTRALPPTPTMGIYVGKTKEQKHLYKYGPTIRRIYQVAEEHEIPKDNNAFVLEERGNTDLMEIDGCGMHFVLIRRDVIEALQPPYFLMGGRGGAGEDFYFCHKVQQAGFPIYWDTTVFTGHELVDGRDFGVCEMLAFSEYVDREFGIIDDHHRWEVERVGP